MADRPPKWLLAVVLTAGVVVPGVVSYWLHTAGFARASDVVWAGGYAAAVLVIWYLWIRPLNIIGPYG